MASLKGYSKGNDRIMKLKLQALEETRSFYKVELKKEDLAGGERDSFLKALEIIQVFILEEKEAERLN